MNARRTTPCAALRQRDGAHSAPRMAPAALDGSSLRWEQETTLRRACSELPDTPERLTGCRRNKRPDAPECAVALETKRTK